MLDAVEFEENNRILLRKINFVFMIPSPSLACSSYKIVLIKKTCNNLHIHF